MRPAYARRDQTAMGLNIGQIPVSLAARPDKAVVTRPSRRDGGDAPGQEQTRAGFGENTLSPGSAALRAIDVSLREARRVVPTVEELREDFRARRAETEAAVAAREATANDARDPATEEAVPAEQATRPEPAPQVRAFEAQRNAASTPASNPAPSRLDVSV